MDTAVDEAVHRGDREGLPLQKYGNEPTPEDTEPEEDEEDGEEAGGEEDNNEGKDSE